MDTLLTDLRHAFRQLSKQRSFVIAATLTLALGIGANTAIFSVVYGVLVRPLPYPDAARIVGLAGIADRQRSEMGVTYLEFEFLAERGSVFSALAASTGVGLNLGVGDAAEHVQAQRVSHDYFRVFGVVPFLGRSFSAEEDQRGGPAVLVLSYDLWRRRFGGDSSVIGRSVQVDGSPATVIGVMPASFAPPSPTDAWSTLAQVGATIGSGENLEVIGRVANGFTPAQASQRMQVAFADYRTRFKEMGLPERLTMQLVPFKALTSLDVRTPVTILFGAIAFVLLIACANVASLMLGRAARDQSDMAVRVALGATRGRIMRQMLTESILLSLTGGTLAIGVATWVVHALGALVPREIAGAGDVRIDGWALLFTFAIALLAGVVSGLVPAWMTAGVDPQGALQAGSTRSTGSAGQGRLRNALVIGEFALSLVLLAGAGLMIRTFANLMRTEPGFDVQHTLSAEIWLTGSRYDSPGSIAAFYRDVVAGLTAEPGVVAASVVEAGLPLERGGNTPVWHAGGRLRGGIDYRTVTPGYFRTLGVPVRQGRDFATTDGAGAAPVAIVNDAFVRQGYFSDGALGKSLTVGGPDRAPRTVVGVVGDVRSFIGSPPPAIVFLPSGQTPIELTRLFNGWFPIHVMVRTERDPATLVNGVTRVLHRVDPRVPVGRVQTMASVLAASLALQRFVMLLLSAFAAVAIALAVVGIYGLTSWFVERASREIGIRVALGAGPGTVTTLVLRRGMTLTLVGTTIGLVGALALTRLLAGLLYNVVPADPVTLVAVTALLAVVAAVACFVPARRAARLDPIVSLRKE